MKQVFLAAVVAVLVAGCGGTKEIPDGYDALAPARDEDKVAAAAAAVEPTGKPTTCGVEFNLDKAGWFVAQGWSPPFNQVTGYKLYISRHDGGPYCPIERVVTEDRIVLRGLEENTVYYLVMTSVMADGSFSKPSPQWQARAVRRQYHLPRSVPQYPES